MFKYALKTCLALFVVSAANATMLNFTLTIAGQGFTGANNDRPLITITNTSTVAAQITSFEVTLGDTTKNWDFSFYDGGLGTSSRTLVSPDTLQGNVRADTLKWNLTGFDAVLTASPDEYARFGAELDNDNVEAGLDFRNVLFNNGATPNATVRVYFLHNGVTKIAMITLADQTLQPNGANNFYTFTGAVPEPGTMSLFGAGVAAVLISRFRRKRA